MTAILLLAGLALLLVGADLLIRGASRLAGSTGLSPLVIGLTVVAFGTSAPELAISVGAAWTGATDLAVGNVVGSNIANILLILGLSAVVAPLTVSRQLIRLDVPVMVAASLLVYALALDGRISRLEGTALIACSLAYTGVLLRAGRQGAGGDDGTSGAPGESVAGRPWRDGLWVLLGLAGLVLGADWLVRGAVTIATNLGISPLVVGLTVIAVGTSLPELATSVIATRRGQREIAVGNAVGSNIFNLLVVLGATAIVAPGGVPVVPAALHFDLPVMTAVAIACLPIFFNGHRLARWEGGLFLAYYLAYTLYLVLDATHHDSLPLFVTAMSAFVLPLTAITLVVVAVRAWKRAPSSSSPDR